MPDSAPAEKQQQDAEHTDRNAAALADGTVAVAVAAVDDGAAGGTEQASRERQHPQTQQHRCHCRNAATTT